MIDDRPPDAIRAPLRHAGEGDSFARLARLQTEFSQVLRTPRVFVRHQGTEHFISGRPDDTLGYPGHEAHSGEPRYDWHDRGDGVRYGYLCSDARSA